MPVQQARDDFPIPGAAYQYVLILLALYEAPDSLEKLVPRPCKNGGSAFKGLPADLQGVSEVLQTVG